MKWNGQGARIGLRFVSDGKAVQKHLCSPSDLMKRDAAAAGLQRLWRRERRSIDRVALFAGPCFLRATRGIDSLPTVHVGVGERLVGVGTMRRDRAHAPVGDEMPHDREWKRGAKIGERRGEPKLSRS